MQNKRRTINTQIDYILSILQRSLESSTGSVQDSELFKFEPLWRNAERRSRVFGSPPRVHECALQISARRPTILTEVFHGLPHSLQVNTRIANRQFLSPFFHIVIH